MSKKYKYFDIKTDGDYYSRGDILQFTDDPVPTFVVRNYNRKWRKIANKPLPKTHHVQPINLPENW